MRIVFVGAGNLATNFGKALHEAGNDILQVYSRTYESASALAMLLDCSPVTNIDKINNDADVYVISVSDNAMADVVPQLCNNGRKDKKSSGIGLYLVKQVCNRLGHKISIESELGKYTRVMIDLRHIDLEVE